MKCDEARRAELRRIINTALAELRAMDAAALPAPAESDELPVRDIAALIGVDADTLRWCCRTEGRGRRNSRGRWYASLAEMRERFAVRE